ncbi:3-deoxy-7-phosphoheptulonate synthase [Burkholderia glumae]|uniref:Phospho-2-dehydro-3-deoxyheptonate aldolase n=2 Tax=Burkholderia glumae TaxID=337 RepID=A0AAP9XWJ1_BURGL|nr:3-deoxy-7-phosphoheptulonate synthase class II [Burkholderia glumae]ACR31538.1 Phospho-2-dehydro-3-deoxyheptonate aldolase [Burkholderia glumae BGR1]AJY62778.1 class-II DAHP synthetase family protein [Burkholderia glumae LMG 2196 = ATCC 33617]MCM2485303.1 3-deoxy-7-phosphoheptulonate synthase [Burkholderia glumae]MCM2510998.1 3-deoxy-7-phosphoheptulonate synthase [Burkholderia glumae]MCM2540826.1 3-deoxy-7-phosphoheptulonate synthase [Burkholderia glumae]
MSTLREPWHPTTWQSMPQQQLPHYVNGAALGATLSRISSYPPLVAIGEIRRLRSWLANVAHGRGFVLQGGDCAETFADFRQDVIRRHYRLLERMAQTIGEASRLPVVRIGRIAGQYAKPRSKPEEERGGRSLPSYRGDIINDAAFDAGAREHDPDRMEAAYFRAAGSLNYLRGLDDTGMFGTGGSYFSSHEALLLPYEQSMVECDELGNWYCCSGHFLWIGERTRQIDGAHVEFLRGVRNPIGLKLGAGIGHDDLLRLIDVLNPLNEAGRLTLIPRMGAGKIDRLAALLETVRREGREVGWMSDPMHGNGTQTRTGIKTRHYADIVAELDGFFAAHRAAGTHPSGVHLELTGLDVTECIGGASVPGESDLERAYLSSCDPRLNADQALSLAGHLAGLLAAHRLSRSHGERAEAGAGAAEAADEEADRYDLERSV